MVHNRTCRSAESPLLDCTPSRYRGHCPPKVPYDLCVWAEPGASLHDSAATGQRAVA